VVPAPSNLPAASDAFLVLARTLDICASDTDGTTGAAEFNASPRPAPINKVTITPSPTIPKVIKR
jgi:hypothetical protein